MKNELEILLKNKDYKSLEVLAPLFVGQMNSLDWYKLMGDIAFESHDYISCVKWFDLILKQSEGNDEIYERMAHAHQKIGFHEGVISNLEAVRTKSLAVHLMLAETYNRRGLIKKAVSQYLEILKSYPYCLTAIDQVLRHDEGSLSDLMSRLPTEMKSYVAIKRLMHQHEPKNALELIRKESGKEYMLLRFDCEIELMKTSDSCQTMQSILRLDPFNVRYMDKYAYLLRILKDFQELNRIVHMLITNHPRRPETWIATAINFERQDEFENAQKSIIEAIELDESHHFIYFIRGAIHMRQKKPYDALACYREKVTSARSLFLYTGVLQSLIAIGKVDEALIESKQVLYLYPNHLWTYYLVGLVAIKQGDYKNARKGFETCMKLYENEELIFEEALLGLVECDVKDENFDTAITLLKRRLDVRQSDSLHSRCGNIYVQMEKYKEALYHYNIALTLNPSSEEAKNGIAKVEKLINPSDDFE